MTLVDEIIHIIYKQGDLAVSWVSQPGRSEWFAVGRIGSGPRDKQSCGGDGKKMKSVFWSFVFYKWKLLCF